MKGEMCSVDLQETFLNEETPSPCLPSFHQGRGASHQKPSKPSPFFLSIKGTMSVFLLQEAFPDWIPLRNFFLLPFSDVKAQDHRHPLHPAFHLTLEETGTGRRLKRKEVRREWELWKGRGLWRGRAPKGGEGCVCACMGEGGGLLREG